ncbi:B12-binding domain-containing radical SAM protein [Candidatus Woesearchaeota archaeon]|nr:B12-binding domain-containing radical SAM protein [Candidatus Woesearchaeota archaeon]
MKILLVYPEYPATFFSLKHTIGLLSKKAFFPPLGLLTIAAMLPADWEKKLVDTNVRALEDSDIAWADLVFVSAMIVQKKSAKEIIGRCRAMGKKVVAGGPVFTTQHEQFEGVDHFVLNEAEVTLPLFLEDVRNGNAKQLYTSAERPDVTKTPVPLWNLIDLNDYATAPVQYSRGCPFDCEFCDIIIMNGRIPRAKTPEQFIREMQALYDWGWRGEVLIVDDNFIGNKANVKKMLPLMITWQKERKYPFRFFTEASTNLADDAELMRMMSEANFSRVFLGIETPNVDSLKECGKLQNVSRNLAETVRTIQKNGLQVFAGFIVGFDSDDESVFETQINFIQQTGIVFAVAGHLMALPQTRLWHRLKAEGRLLSDTTGEHTDGSLNFMPRMGKEKLIAGYKKIISTVYSPKLYCQRIDTFIKNYIPTVRRRVSKQEIRAFLMSVWKIGILSEARLLYWRIILKAAFTKPKALPEAVELAVLWPDFKKFAATLISGSQSTALPTR